MNIAWVSATRLALLDARVALHAEPKLTLLAVPYHHPHDRQLGILTKQNFYCCTIALLSTEEPRGHEPAHDGSCHHVLQQLAAFVDLDDMQYLPPVTVFHDFSSPHRLKM